MRYIYAALIIIAAVLVLAGCASSSPPSVVGGVTTPPAADGIEQWEHRAYSSASLGAAAYLSQRERLDPKAREAIRVAWLAFDSVIYASMAEGQSLGDPADALAAAITQRVPPKYRPLAMELVKEIVYRLRAKIPVTDLSREDSWRIAVAVHRGILHQLTLAGIDPTKRVEDNEL